MPTVQESITYLCDTWHLSDIQPLVARSPTRNYVARAYSAVYKSDVVLKILVEESCEPQVLRLFNGNGYVKLLEYDQEHNAFLVERVTPGATLSVLFPHDDTLSLKIMASLIKKMHSADLQSHIHEFPTVEQWMEEMYACTSDKIPKELLIKAYELSQRLLRTEQSRYVLHGDLHHENMKTHLMIIRGL